MLFLRIFCLFCFCLSLKASLFSDQEFLEWLDQAATCDRVDTEFIESQNFDQKAAVLYLTQIQTSQHLDEESLEAGKKAILSHSEFLITKRILTPWEKMFCEVLGGLMAPVPKYSRENLIGLAYIRGISGAQILAERLSRIEGLRLGVSRLCLQ